MADRVREAFGALAELESPLTLPDVMTSPGRVTLRYEGESALIAPLIPTVPAGFVDERASGRGSDPRRRLLAATVAFVVVGGVIVVAALLASPSGGDGKAGKASVPRTRLAKIYSVA